MSEIPRYDHKAIESKWQRQWREIGLFDANEADPRPKYYCLMMFPYPSGDRLHVGHGRNYILGDVVVRYKIMTGHNVLSPMGWDAFGLPAENDAIKKGIQPWISVRDNIGRMKAQFQSWGVGYDWRRELATCDPGYYKWTQWLFLQLYKHDLAYRKKAPVNWCPSCKTVLANEQVEDDDTCERCGSKVEKKDLTQWFFRITKYADRLLDDLDRLGTWPERVKTLQRNWIDRSEGARIDFALEDGTPLPVFTTRPDTLFGVTYVSVAPEHPIAARAAAATPEIAEKLTALKDKMAFFKTQAAVDMTVQPPKEGFATGLFALNPANGERVPVYVASYALMDYGTGAVMAVPAHDQRDFEFAKVQGLPIRVVIDSPAGDLDAASMTAAYTEAGTMTASGEFTGLASDEGKAKITDWLVSQKKGARETRYRLRDWLVSRQRYWGAPIPIVHCATCGLIPVPEEQLPVLLPHDAGMEVVVKPSGSEKSPLSNVEEWVETVCPRCGDPAERETDTLDTFVDSAWYFLRFCSPHVTDRPFDRGAVDAWMAVKQYIGGAEHATKHLIYARFITKVLCDLKFVGFVEPFRDLFSQGLICKRDAAGELKRMSKSKGNVVNPDELIEKFGADTQRLYTLFIGPPERDAEWSDDGIIGCWKFLNRLWTACHEAAPHLPKDRTPIEVAALSREGRALRRKTHQTIGKVTDDIEGAFGFHTATSAVMELLNLTKSIDASSAPEADRRALRDALEACVILLAPIVPHIGEELWRLFASGGDAGGAPPRQDVTTIFREPWPELDEDAAKPDEIEYVIQVNGKVRARELLPAETGEAELRLAVMKNARITALLDGKAVAKTIIVPGKLVNLVVK